MRYNTYHDTLQAPRAISCWRHPAAPRGCFFIVFVNRLPLYSNVRAVHSISNLNIVLPAQLPAGATITQHPMHDAKTGGVVTAIDIGGYRVVFSQQKKPSTNLKQLDAEENYLVNAGSVYILKSEQGRLQAIVETSDSWLMINTDAELGVNVFKRLIEQLRVIEP